MKNLLINTSVRRFSILRAVKNSSEKDNEELSQEEEEETEEEAHISLNALTAQTIPVP